jgi:hypothetical protein
MFRSKRTIGDVLAFVGAIPAITGFLLPPAQYLAWFWSDVWSPMTIRAAFEAMRVSTPQAINAVIRLPLWIAMFTVGLVFIWTAAEVYERYARSLRAKIPPIE